MSMGAPALGWVRTQRVKALLDVTREAGEISSLEARRQHLVGGLARVVGAALTALVTDDDFGPGRHGRISAIVAEGPVGAVARVHAEHENEFDPALRGLIAASHDSRREQPFVRLRDQLVARAVWHRSACFNEYMRLDRLDDGIFGAVRTGERTVDGAVFMRAHGERPFDEEDRALVELRDVGGANFNYVTVDPSILPLADVGKTLANDEINMLRAAADDGLHVLDKHVPAYMIFDDQGNPSQILSGGFYQCASLADCQGYLDEVIPNYRLDGVAFPDRPEFHGSFQGHAYEVLGAAQFRPVTDDYALRIIRWQITTSNTDALRTELTARWHAMRNDACRRGTLAQAHLLWSEAEQVVAEVLVGVKEDAPAGSPEPYFQATLADLASAPALGPSMAGLPLELIPPQVTDTYLAITYWPSAFAPSLWLNSPSTTPGGPLPEPFCGDGSCNTTAAHVENAETCPADCLPTCGNGVCDPGESASTCAVDCLPQ